MFAASIEMLDLDGDGVLTIRDDGASFSGVDLELSNFDERVIAVLDKQQMLKWCETVAAHLRKQGVEPRTGEIEGGYVKRTPYFHTSKVAESGPRG